MAEALFYYITVTKQLFFARGATSPQKRKHETDDFPTIRGSEHNSAESQPSLDKTATAARRYSSSTAGAIRSAPGGSTAAAHAVRTQCRPWNRSLGSRLCAAGLSCGFCCAVSYAVASRVFYVQTATSAHHVGIESRRGGIHTAAQAAAQPPLMPCAPSVADEN